VLVPLTTTTEVLKELVVVRVMTVVLVGRADDEALLLEVVEAPVVEAMTVTVTVLGTPATAVAEAVFVTVDSSVLLVAGAVMLGLVVDAVVTAAEGTIVVVTVAGCEACGPLPSVTLVEPSSLNCTLPILMPASLQILWRPVISSFHC